MEKSVGRLINSETDTELDFSLTPVEVHVDQSMDLRVEPILGEASPIVSFASGGTKTLSTQLIFDRDADESLDLAKVQKFFKGLTTVADKTKSIPIVQFKLGFLNFQGYLQRLGMSFARFSSDGKAGQIRVDLTLISSEEGENSGKL